MENRMIHWNLSTQQADQILNILAQRPFAEVNALIAELLRQAQEKPQARPLAAVPPAVPPAVPFPAEPGAA
jgi:hypothetical protein